MQRMAFLRRGLFYLALIGLVFFSLLGPPEPAGASEEDEWQRVHERIEETKEELSQRKREERTVLDSLLRAQRELKEIEEELEELNRNIALTEQAVSSLRQKLARLEQEIRLLEQQRLQRQDKLNNRLVAVYKYGATNYLELLFSAENFADLISKFETVSYFLRNDLAFIEETLAAGEVLAQKKNELAAGEKLLLDQHRNYSRLKERAAERQRQKVALIAKTESELRQIQEDKQRLEAALDELERLSREIEEKIREKQRADEVLGSGTLIWPVTGRLISPFGWRHHPILKTRRFHSGIDIAVPTGTPVKAADSGRVLMSGWNGGYGYFIAIDHGNGISTAYAHNSRLLVKENDLVVKGQTIALSGSTGWSTGPHLHFEVRENGAPADPMKYLPK